MSERIVWKDQSWDVLSVTDVIRRFPDRRRKLANCFYRTEPDVFVPIKFIRLAHDFTNGYKFYDLIAEDGTLYPISRLHVDMLGGSTRIYRKTEVTKIVSSRDLMAAKSWSFQDVADYVDDKKANEE